MAEENCEDIVSLASRRLPQNLTKPLQIYFTRQELSLILSVYGRKVAAGRWRDYTIDTTGNLAIFSVFKRSSEAPLYQIIKDPSLRRRQGMWRICAMNGQILKRGHDLTQVLNFFKDDKAGKTVLAFA